MDKRERERERKKWEEEVVVELIPLLPVAKRTEIELCVSSKERIIAPRIIRRILAVCV